MHRIVGVDATILLSKTILPSERSPPRSSETRATR